MQYDSEELKAVKDKGVAERYAFLKNFEEAIEK
jgi:hypothetical protein